MGEPTYSVCHAEYAKQLEGDDTSLGDQVKVLMWIARG